MSSPMTKPCLTEMKQGSKLFYSVFRPSRMYSPDEFSVYQKNKCLIFPLIQLPSLLKPFGSRGIYVLLILARFFIPRIPYGTKKRGLCCSLSSVGIGKRIRIVRVRVRVRRLLLVIFSRHRQTPCSDKKQRPALRLYHSFCKDESFEKKNTTERKHSLSIIPLQLKFCRFH